MLRAVAETGGGMYYFINAVDDIPTAFADCLGGVMSVVAQNTTLTLEAMPQAAIGKVLGSAYKVETQINTVVDLGDLYSDDTKDILFELDLAALPAPQDAQPVLKAKLRYFSVAACSMQEATAELIIARPATTPADQPVHHRLDEQRNRMRAAEAMEMAARLADDGDLEGGRALLADTWTMVNRSASAATPLSTGLTAEMMQLADAYEDMPRYRSLGQKMSKMSAACHYQQRSNHVSAGMYSAGAKGKDSLKQKWSSMCE